MFYRQQRPLDLLLSTRLSNRDGGCRIHCPLVSPHSMSSHLHSLLTPLHLPRSSSRPQSLLYHSHPQYKVHLHSTSLALFPTPPSSCHCPPSPLLCRYHLLYYTYVDNMIERRTPVRPLHLAYATPYVERQQLLLGGACPPQLRKAVLVFHASKEEVEEFAQKDPYVLHQLVTDWRIREWTVVLGSAMKK